MGIHSAESSQKLKLNRWWLASGASPCHKILLSLIPTCVCWELWVNRNKARFENKKQTAALMIANITVAIQGIMNQKSLVVKRRVADDAFLRFFSDCVAAPRSTEFIISKWICLPSGRLKLNSDGCSRGNPGESGGGSVLRDDKGRVLWAQADSYGVTKNMVAECRALLQGLKLCAASGVASVDIEVDSMVLVQIMQQQASIP